MTLRPWMLGLAGAAVSAFAPLASAQVTPALDRVPADALVAGSFKNLNQFFTDLNSMATALKLPAEAMMGITHVGEVLKTPGVNADSSAAFALMPGAMDGEHEQGPVVIVVPVKDYAGFVGGLGGKPEGVSSVELDGKPLFVKDIGGGFAAVGPMQDIVTNFKGEAGGGKTFESMTGPSGKAVMEGSDAFVVFNIPALAPKIREGMAGLKENMEMAMMMAGGAQQPNMAKAEALMEAFVRDGRGAILGLDMADAGVKLDMASHFAEGSEMAKYFTGAGNAEQLLAALPGEPYYIAMAVDVSSPGLKQAFKTFGDLGGEAGKENPLGNLNPLAALDKTDGMAFFWGTSPALMGGLFLNTVAYVKTSDPAAYTATVKDVFTELNGKQLEGVTYQTQFQPGATKVGEKAVDSWSMKIQPDPTNPQAQQMAQGMMMMFGPTGLGGYMAPAKDGVVVTYSKNTDLLTKALSAADTAAGLDTDAGVKSVAANLPGGRSITGFIGVKSIMETAIGFMGMMGGGPADFNVPADLPPIGFGAVTKDGGVRGTLFVPSQVISTIQSLVESMEQGEEDMGEDAGDEGGEE